MTDPGAMASKADLLRTIEASRAALDAHIRAARPEQFTAKQDAAGWTAKDHISHLGAWERSLIALLSGRPRWRALGIDAELLASRDFDRMNEAIADQHRNRPLALVLSEYQEVHEQAMALIRRLTEEELRKPFSAYLPDEPHPEAENPVQQWVEAETHGHFDEHGPQIRDLLA